MAEQLYKTNEYDGNLNDAPVGFVYSGQLMLCTNKPEEINIESRGLIVSIGNSYYGRASQLIIVTSGRIGIWCRWLGENWTSWTKLV